MGRASGLVPDVVRNVRLRLGKADRAGGTNKLPHDLA